MKDEETKGKTEEPFSGYGHYTYADYLSWEIDGMVELIKGKVFRQVAAPRRVHQEVSVIVLNRLYEYLRGNTCKVYAAPFDVRLPVKSKKHEDIDTVVQPDICVVCDPSKLDDRGCVGAPDLVVEILSPGNNRKELNNKYEVYEEAGVGEYWIIHPDERTLLIYTLRNGRYHPSKLFTMGDVVFSEALHGFSLDLENVFSELG